MVEMVMNNQQPPSMHPPSDVILSVYKKYKNIAPDDIICATSEDILLPVRETRMWFEHLHQVSLNQKIGAKRQLQLDPRERQWTNNQWLMIQ